MNNSKLSTPHKLFYQFLRRRASILMMAFMLGISNVILEEDRMINDTRAKIEQQELQADDETH